MSVALTAARRSQLDLEGPLAPEHERIVRDTLPLVGAHIEQIAPVFYQRMFTAHPELLRDTFNRGNQAQGAQQKALASSVATYATLLVTPDAPSPRDLLSRIGHKHVSLGITEDQYGIVHEHLMAAIVEVLGDDVVTADIAGAWDAVYWHMARTLISFEKEMYADAGVADGDVFREAVVVRRTEESSRVVSFDLAAPEGVEPLRGFLPGQYISVGAVLPDGARQLRQYSLSDAPGGGAGGSPCAGRTASTAHRRARSRTGSTRPCTRGTGCRSPSRPATSPSTPPPPIRWCSSRPASA
ncbi:globin domain-containing protein [Brachybacterium sp. UNK5269]|uniref:globin domain-containing protein n=1 Tax=Brachybacterium sp. UNK5269 TaxID=3408576 RepID=UPI003BB1AA5B